MPNRYPASVVTNMSLAKTAASSFAVYVPLHFAQPNVNYFSKEEPPKKTGGETLDLIPSHFKDMQGAGKNITEIALHHPIKVLQVLIHY